MDIIVSTPGSPGTTFTENVKAIIIAMYNELENNDNYESLSDFKNHLGDIGFKKSYIRNILPFMQFCGFVKYDEVKRFENKKMFTSTGKAYIEVLKSIKIAENEEIDEEQKERIKELNAIQEKIYFQSLVRMMKCDDCSYAKDFLDVLRYVVKYKYINQTEYMLLIDARTKGEINYIEALQENIAAYRAGIMELNVKTKTKSGLGDAKSVNSFPYVTGNFIKAGVFEKKEDNGYYIKFGHEKEVNMGIKEVEAWMNRQSMK